MNGKLNSTAAASFKQILVFTMLWNLIAMPVGWFVLEDIRYRWPDPAWLVLLFPLVGLILIGSTISRYLQWRRFGRLNLTLDPYPGSLGNDLGGHLDIPVPYRSDLPFEVTLNCVHVRITRTAKGGSSRHEDVIWRRDAATRVEPAIKGTRLVFSLPIDAGLPPSGEPSNDYHQWVLRIRLVRPGIDLNREFPIPVSSTASPRASAIRVRQKSEQITDLPAHIVRIEGRGGGLSLYFPARRNMGMGTGMFLIGLIFAGGAGFIDYQFIDALRGFNANGLIFQVVVLGIMGLAFSLVALLLVPLGLYTLGNSVRLKADLLGVESERRVFGIPVRKKLNRSDIGHLEKRITAQSGQGANARVYYTISARTASGKRVTLVDGVEGQPTADRVMSLISENLSLKTEAVTEDKKHFDRFRGIPVSKRLRAGRRSRRWLSTVFGLLVLALFVVDMIRMFG